MRLALRPASEGDFAFCEALTRTNMATYLAARGSPWHRGRFLASWADFENYMILEEGQAVGLLRLKAEQGVLEIRDLQVTQARQRHGIGAWAARQAQSLAAGRGLQRMQLRVYEENPAKALYERLGFKAMASAGGIVHMSQELPGHPSRPNLSPEGG